MDQSLTPLLDLETSFNFGTIKYRQSALHCPVCSDNVSLLRLHFALVQSMPNTPSHVVGQHSFGCPLSSKDGLGCCGHHSSSSII